MIGHEAFQAMAAVRPDLSPSEQQLLDKHLAACLTCRARAEEYGRQDAFLRALPIPDPVRSIRDTVLSARAERRKSSLSRYHWVGGFLAAAAIAAVIVFAFARSHGPVGSNAALVPFGPQRDQAPHTPIASGSGADLNSGAPSGRKRAPGANPSSPPAAPYEPVATGPVVVNTEALGVRLLLIVPHRSYPRNAVIRVQVRITNHSRTAVQISASVPYGCEQGGPYVEDVDGRGNPVFPLPPGPIPSCPLIPPKLNAPPAANFPGSLRPGATMATLQYVVLVSPRLRIIANIGSYGRCKAYQNGCGLRPSVDGRVLTLQLTAPNPPRASLRVKPPAGLFVVPLSFPSARVTKPLLWYSWLQRCRTSGRGVASMSDLVRGGISRGNRVPLATAGCDLHHIALHIAAGWVGVSVRIINYVRGMPPPK